MNNEKILKHFQYISFDIFDTLIKRSVSVPTDIFGLMEQQYNQSAGIKSNFAEKRIRANQVCESRNGGQSACLADIYNELREDFGLYTDWLMELEIQMEIDGCRPNATVVDFFRKCVAEGKTVVLISDMYLPIAVIAQMLKRCDIQGYKKIYVSCEEEARKRDGRLFHKVIDELNIKPSQLLHIGDSWKSDFIQAICAGAHANHVKNDQKELSKIPKNITPNNVLHYRTLSACIRNCSHSMNEYEKQGCEMFGPLLLGFTQWLKERLKHNGITEVFFLTRDGYTMKRAFDCLATSEFNTYYINSSRRAFTVPLYWKASSLDEILSSRHFSKNGKMSVRSFLDLIGLEPEQYKNRAYEYGLNMDYVYVGRQFTDNSSVISFFNSVKGDMVINSRQEYEALLAYLQPYGIHGRIAVVDVGYQGTIQYALEKILAEAKIEASVKGFYVGLSPKSVFVQKGEIEAEGYLCDIGKNEEMYSIVSNVAGIIESLFCETCGSTKRFVMWQGKGVPECSQCIYDSENGRLVDESSIIADYQNGAQKLIEYYHEVYPNGIPDIEPEVSVSRLARMGLSPTLKEAKLWGDFRIDKFIQTGNQYLARPRNVWVYLLHPVQLKRDIITSWNIGLFRRLFILPLPYDKLLDLLRNIYLKKTKRSL